MSRQSRILHQLEIIATQKRRGLMMHIMAGYPDIATSFVLAQTLIQSGIDFLEIQIPFRDPMSDGPTFMRANEYAVGKWVNFSQACSLIRHIRAQTKIPIIVMWYFNTVFKQGAETFCAALQLAGADGCIVPDYPIDVELREHFIQTCHQHELSFIPVYNASSPEHRILQGAKLHPPFLYFGARKSTTGAQVCLEEWLASELSRVSKLFSGPLAVGWWISSAQHIRSLPKEATIAIVGSKTLDIFHERRSASDIGNFAAQLRAACNSFL